MDVMSWSSLFFFFWENRFYSMHGIVHTSMITKFFRIMTSHSFVRYVILLIGTVLPVSLLDLMKKIVSKNDAKTN